MFPLTSASGNDGTTSVHEAAQADAQAYQENMANAYNQRTTYNKLAFQEDKKPPYIPHDDPERKRVWEEMRKSKERAEEAMQSHKKLSQENEDIEPMKEWYPGYIKQQTQAPNRKNKQKGRKKARGKDMARKAKNAYPPAVKRHNTRGSKSSS
ncbi:hypothetical protein MMC10_000630 [Thelotrema lepadinum]|nr:hypothetical protein [Thelotrema lepadinum]